MTPAIATFPPRPATPPPADPLWRAAQALETGFLSELLRMSDPGAPAAGFGGGAGEAQFRSFLFEAQADRMVAAGGIGLAQRLYAAMADAR
ncbi:rod-binding protein [Limimaricola hongkongensis]|uniref:Chemotactic signal-response protein, putative n=1 Tax=Limimaricola hongkongensis DSM 17492 TaxID=1122180 RepID=A0A017HFR7_9RHOB|nr:rod-binding protein [Limimaricola hongkongensis]EYD73145.1 chemotactic signal-response protein, putative [Limimaricola hongkongensis DSM 17492]